jgi:hypothetical protein
VWSVFWVSLIGRGVVPRIWRGSDSVAQAGGRCLKGHFYILTAFGRRDRAGLLRPRTERRLPGRAGLRRGRQRHLPTILFSLYWKRFTTSGAVTGILVGLIGSLLLVVVGPNVMGPKGLIFKGSDPLFPLENPGIVSIPLGFAAAWLGTMLSREPASEEMYEELRVRALTGLGAEEAEAAPTPAAPRPAR